MNNINTEIDKLTNWLKDQAKFSTYSELGIKIIIHDCHVTRIEKSIIEKTKPTQTGGRNVFKSTL